MYAPSSDRRLSKVKKDYGMIISLQELHSDRIDPFSLLDEEIRERLLRAAMTDISILLLGETGTGKGQLARAITAHSKRKEIVEINCAALPDELLGSELFGHKRGAFTGAISDRKGILASSAGKTVFLDEIGEISPKMQRMLLSIVQRSHRLMKPLGSDDEIPVPPLRFIFATNRNLECEVASGRFREDLLRRIDVLSVKIPPLRSRSELIKGYIGTFLCELSLLHSIPVLGIEKKALNKLEKYFWPGNVREVKNCMERALVTSKYESDGGIIISEDDIILQTPKKSIKTLDETEGDEIRRALDTSRGKIKDAMKILGIKSRSAFYFRLEKYGIKLDRIARKKKDEGANDEENS